MTRGTDPKTLYIKIWLSPDELERFAGHSLTTKELNLVLHKLPDLIWGFVGEDGMETFVKGILED